MSDLKDMTHIQNLPKLNMKVQTIYLNFLLLKILPECFFFLQNARDLDGAAFSGGKDPYWQAVPFAGILQAIGEWEHFSILQQMLFGFVLSVIAWRIPWDLLQGWKHFLEIRLLKHIFSTTRENSRFFCVHSGKWEQGVAWVNSQSFSSQREFYNWLQQKQT